MILRLLKAHYDKKKSENPNFTLRLLAQKINMSPAYISLIFKGKRNLSFTYLERICTALDLDNDSRNELIIEYLKQDGLRNIADLPIREIGELEGLRNVQVSPVGNKKFTLLTPWYMLPIIDSTLLKDYDGSAQWIAKKLNLDQATVEEAIMQLLNHSLLEDRDGKFLKKEANIEFRSGKNLEEIRSHHLEFLDLAREQLAIKTEKDDFERRLISGMTVAISKEKAKSFKYKLNQLLYSFLKEAQEDEDVSDVYRLSIQLFPLT